MLVLAEAKCVVLMLLKRKYTYAYSVLVLAVATPKCVVHMLLEQGIHTHIYSMLVLDEVRRAHAFRTRYTHTYIACLF